MKEIEKENVNLLWTGGWDSTFQLLQLVLVQRLPVTTYYLINPEKRRSTCMELRTIKRIKEHLWKEYPHTRDLLKSTHYSAVADIAKDAEITESFQKISNEIVIGKQYEWISRFCKEYKIRNMQLCIHHHDHGRHCCEELIVEGSDRDHALFCLDPAFEGTDRYIVYSCFSFPLFRHTKMEMYEIAVERKFLDVMGMTWFCHTPTSDMSPCGKCGPCIQAIEEGLGWRLPIRRRVVSFFYRRTIHPFVKPVINPLLAWVRRLLCKLGVLEPV